MGIMDRIKEEANSAISATMNTTSTQPQQQAQPQAQPQPQQMQYQPQMRIPQYVVLQVTLKEKFIGTGSGNLSELENVINRQAAQGYRLHTISTAAGGSVGIVGGDRIQATLVFEKL